MALTGIILAGGKSSRMGQDKALIDYNGKKLIEYAIELLTPICDQLLISANQPGYDQFGLPIVEDVYKNRGPVGGLHAALKATKTQWNIVISCDTPFLNRKLFDLLLSQKEGFQSVIPKHSHGVEPMAALYHASLASFFKQKIKQGDLKLQRIIKEQAVNFPDVSELLQTYPRLFDNLNTPEELL